MQASSYTHTHTHTSSNHSQDESEMRVYVCAALYMLLFLHLLRGTRASRSPVSPIDDMRSATAEKASAVRPAIAPQLMDYLEIIRDTASREKGVFSFVYMG